MNGIEKITQRIEADVQAEIDDVLGKARAKADEIRTGYEAQAAKARAEAESRSRRAAQDREARLVDAAEMDRRKLLLSAKVTEIADGAVRYEKDGKSGAVECDKALISIGRRPNIKDVGLESIGVLTERGAIVTDSRMRTNQPEVYAAGDVNGRSMLAHTAYREAEVAVNTMLGKRDNMRYDAIPAVLYTNPELSGVGYTEAAAAAAGLDARTVTLPMRYSGRYVAENEGGDGIFKLVVNNRDNTILGAQALCNYSSEFIIAAASFIEQRLTLDDIKEIVFPHPTVSEIIREAVFQA